MVQNFRISRRRGPLAALILLGTQFVLVTPADAQDLLFADGIEDCSMMDRDFDRVRDCHEIAVGSDPAAKDTDGDGLEDGDEILGTLNGLFLPAFGVKPTHKDILLEIDWVADSWQCVEG